MSGIIEWYRCLTLPYAAWFIGTDLILIPYLWYNLSLDTGCKISRSIVIYFELFDARVECKESDIVLTSNFGTDTS